MTLAQDLTKPQQNVLADLQSNDLYLVLSSMQSEHMRVRVAVSQSMQEMEFSSPAHEQSEKNTLTLRYSEDLRAALLRCATDDGVQYSSEELSPHHRAVPEFLDDMVEGAKLLFLQASVHYMNGDIEQAYDNMEACLLIGNRLITDLESFYAAETGFKLIGGTLSQLRRLSESSDCEPLLKQRVRKRLMELRLNLPASVKGAMQRSVEVDADIAEEMSKTAPDRMRFDKEAELLAEKGRAESLKYKRQVVAAWGTPNFLKIMALAERDAETPHTSFAFREYRRVATGEKNILRKLDQTIKAITTESEL
jgi:hypothetical protein